MLVKVMIELCVRSRCASSSVVMLVNDVRNMGMCDISGWVFGFVVSCVMIQVGMCYCSSVWRV